MKGFTRSTKAALAWEEAKANHPEQLAPFYRAAIRDSERLSVRRAKQAKVRFVAGRD